MASSLSWVEKRAKFLFWQGIYENKTFPLLTMCVQGTLKSDFQNQHYMTIKSTNLQINVTKGLNIIIQNECTQQKWKIHTFKSVTSSVTMSSLGHMGCNC